MRTRPKTRSKRSGPSCAADPGERGARDMPEGYSGTPLARKLGFTDALDVWARALPYSVRSEIEFSAFPRFRARPGKAPGAAILFHTAAEELEADLARLRPILAPSGMVWVCWPKKAAKVETDITEDTVRRLALPMGYVDVKVCAVDAVWSGLKLVIRKALRP
jgi:hypothetical protein